MEILLVWSVGLICLLAFYFGFSAGKGEQIANKEIELPNPMKVYREHQEKQEVKRKQERDSIIMQNIDNYDDTPNGQKDVPN